MKTSWFKAIFILVIIQCAFSNLTKAQPNDAIYYFRGTKDTSLIGIRNAAGIIILPAEYYVLEAIQFEQPIMEPLIELRRKVKTESGHADIPAIPVGEVYDRKGHFLYSPQYFDNGSDYFKEGLRRYVSHEKIGFVDKAGKQVIHADWDFATPFNYGYAQVYSGGWKRQLDKSGEHWTVVPANKKAITYLIDKKGQKVTAQPNRNKPEDYQLDGKFYPYPFYYNAFEKQLLDSVRSSVLHSTIPTIQRPLSKAAVDVGQRLQFEITAGPTTYFPYYTIQGFREQQPVEEMTFLVDRAGQQYYHYIDDGTNQKAPMESWLHDQVSDSPPVALKDK